MDEALIDFTLIFKFVFWLFVLSFVQIMLYLSTKYSFLGHERMHFQTNSQKNNQESDPESYI